MMKLSGVVFAISCLVSTTALAESPAPDWDQMSKLSKLWSKVREGKGKLIGSTGHSWPDGRQASLLYFQVEGQLWSCPLYFDKSMSYTGSTCYRLKPE